MAELGPSLAKIRWRIEHDYRELKHGLGLDHFEGRSWAGWHHHVTLVTAAHDSSPNSAWPQKPIQRTDAYQILDAIQDLLNCWTGTCTTCHRPLPRTSTTSPNPRARAT